MNRKNLENLVQLKCPYKKGQMTEYGWFNLEIELEIMSYMMEHNCNDREEALINIFQTS